MFFRRKFRIFFLNDIPECSPKITFKVPSGLAIQRQMTVISTDITVITRSCNLMVFEKKLKFPVLSLIFLKNENIDIL